MMRIKSIDPVLVCAVMNFMAGWCWCGFMDMDCDRGGVYVTIEEVVSILLILIFCNLWIFHWWIRWHYGHVDE